MHAGILPSRQELLSRIDLVCGLDSSFVCVTGEQGIGKTALLEFFIEHQCPAQKKCFIHATANQAPFELCEQVFSQLTPGATFDSHLTLIQNLANFEFEGGLDAIIVIDNGHHVGIDVFEQLIELIKSSQYQVSVVFSAMRDSNKLTQLNSLHSLVEMHLEPLDNTESEMLLNFYYGDMVDGDRGQVKQFIQQSAGLPSELLKWQQDGALGNGKSAKRKDKHKDKHQAKKVAPTLSEDDLVLQRLAGEAEAESTKKTDKSKSNQVVLLAAGILLLVVAGASWYFIPKQSDEQMLSQQELREQLRQSVAQQEAEQQAKEHQQQAQTNEAEAVKADDLIAQKWQDDRPIPDDLKFDSPEDKAVEDPKVIEIIRRDKPLLAQTQLTDKSVNEDTLAEVKQADKVEVAVTIESKQQAKQQPKAKAAEIKPEKVEPEYLKGMDNQWFMAQDANQSMIQLAGLSQKNVLTNYIAEHQLKDKAKVYQSVRYGKAWYVVTLGPYPNLAAARGAIGELSTKLQANSPWAKSIKAIQLEIANAKE